MQYQLNNPDLQKFVADKVDAGDYPSVEAVVESALSQMRDHELAISDEDADAINRAEEEMDRGEYVE
jgi:Arc/MetJ-type ribon-helix-helix transcriptional regulator